MARIAVTVRSSSSRRLLTSSSRRAFPIAIAAQVGEHDGGLLVLVGELLAAFLLGQVEVAPSLAADDERHAEEGGHRRVADREAIRADVGADVRQAQGLGLADQLAEHAVAAGKVSDLAPRVLVDADGQEPLQLGPSRVEHAERCVTGAGQLARHRQHALKDRLEL